VDQDIAAVTSVDDVPAHEDLAILPFPVRIGAGGSVSGVLPRPCWPRASGSAYISVTSLCLMLVVCHLLNKPR